MQAWRSSRTSCTILRCCFIVCGTLLTWENSSGGHKTDEAVTQDTTQSQNPVGSGNVPGTGQGSHFGSSRTGGDQPLSSSANPTSSTTGTHGLREPHSSRMPGSFDDDAATTASVKSGIPGSSQTGGRLQLLTVPLWHIVLHSRTSDAFSNANADLMSLRLYQRPAADLRTRGQPAFVFHSPPIELWPNGI